MQHLCSITLRTEIAHNRSCLNYSQVTEKQRMSNMLAGDCVQESSHVSYGDNDSVNQRTVDNLITELLLWLLDERVPRMDDGSQLLKALNVLMLKILDNAERTSSFVVLINLLKPLDPSRWPSPPSNESFATRNMKFSDLVVKCLIKLTKVLQSTIYEVDLDRILQSIHIYLQELGMEEIRRSLPPSYAEDDRSGNVMSSRGPIPAQSEDERNFGKF